MARLLPYPLSIFGWSSRASVVFFCAQTIPEERQTLLFSATLPRMLAQFARAGLRDPTLIRLDMDSKVSEQLCLGFFHVRSGNKNAALLYLLREVRARAGWKATTRCL
jgi:superfamily II DNA/RNA helicase